MLLFKEDLDYSFGAVSLPPSSEAVAVEIAPIPTALRACYGHGDLFFAPNHPEFKDMLNRRVQAAKSICQTCPIIDSCLENALSTGQKEGIWGGKTEQERRLILRKRGKSKLQ